METGLSSAPSPFPLQVEEWGDAAARRANSGFIVAWGHSYRMA